jgi:hypothetical protein
MTNLKSQYRRLFEGRSSSNDSSLLREDASSDISISDRKLIDAYIKDEPNGIREDTPPIEVIEAIVDYVNKTGSKGKKHFSWMFSLDSINEMDSGASSYHDTLENFAHYGGGEWKNELEDHIAKTVGEEEANRYNNSDFFYDMALANVDVEKIEPIR